MAMAAQPAHERKRVKVYELKSNDWYDRGTGFCAGCHINDEAHIHVQSEDEPDRTLLDTKICKDDGYQKQQDTLIVWTEASVTDMALSFQEAEGCAVIWDFISEEQQKLGGGVIGADDVLSDDVMESAHAIMLPIPSLTNITEIESAVRAASTTAGSRDALARSIISTEYLTKLVPLVKDAEDLQSHIDLHRLCTIMKTLILLNDHTIIEQVVSDELFMGVVGALEYDPDFPTQKANHRLYLSSAAKYKEVVKIDDSEVQRKIHCTYRLQYLKDVVLARILDDGTFTALNSLIYFHQMSIIQYVQGNLMYLRKLFELFAATAADLQKKKDALHFIQACCNVAKVLQVQQRAALYQGFMSEGLLSVIEFALDQQDPTTRVAGTEILGALLEHDASLLRTHISRTLSDGKSKPLTDALIELLLVEQDLGVQSQLADAIKHLMDPMPGPLEPGTRNIEFLAKLRSNHLSQSDTALNKYYEEATKKLFRPLKDLEGRKTLNGFSRAEAMLFSHLLDILSVLVKQYHLRSRMFFLSDPLAPRIAQLLSSPEKHLQLAALKYFRSCIGLHESFYNHQFISHDLWQPILNALVENLPRDNLLVSACLELFEFIKRENFKELTVHLVEKYRALLEQISSIGTFRELIEKYERIIAPVTDNLSFTSVETEQRPTSRQSTINTGPVSRWQGSLEVESEEHSFFNDADQDAEEDESQVGGVLKPVSNGASPLKPLVDYPADEDDDIDVLAEDEALVRPLQSSEIAASTARHETPTPPERVVGEKKRGREENEEEDELAKFGATPTKRRSSSLSRKDAILDSSTSETGRGNTAASPNGGTTPASTRQLRRKHSINSEATSKKKSTSLAVKGNSGHQTSTSPPAE